jgi:hypothetical protein
MTLEHFCQSNEYDKTYWLLLLDKVGVVVRRKEEFRDPNIQLKCCLDDLNKSFHVCLEGGPYLL